MLSIHRLLWGVLILASAAAAQAAPQDAPASLRLYATSRTFVTLVPRSAEPDEVGWRAGDALAANPYALNMSLAAARRNRLEFSLTHTDVIARGDRLRLRLASDAHVIAQLLSGGQFSEADDSWIAILGLASRVKVSYELSGWELSISARRRFGQSDVRGRLAYAIRF